MYLFFPRTKLSGDLLLSFVKLLVRLLFFVFLLKTIFWKAPIQTKQSQTNDINYRRASCCVASLASTIQFAFDIFLKADTARTMELRKPLICFGYEAKFDETHPFQASTQRRHNENLIFQLYIEKFFFSNLTRVYFHLSFLDCGKRRRTRRSSLETVKIRLDELCKSYLKLWRFKKFSRKHLSYFEWGF